MATLPSQGPGFLKEALDHHLRDGGGRDLIRISPAWSWAMLAAVAGLFLAGLAFGIFGRIEVVERGRGILRPAGGVRMLTAQAPGVVAEILAPAGAAVASGEPVLRLSSVQLQAALLEADQALRARSQGFAAVARGHAELFAVQVEAARERIRQATEEIASFERSAGRARERLAATEKLYQAGIIGRLEHQAALDNLEVAGRQLAASEHGLRQARQALATLEAQRRQQVWGQATDQAEARTRRQALEFSLGQTVLAAPVDGIVDALLVRTGDPVQAGTVVARVVPRDAPLRVVAMLNERDRAFVREGDGVALELDQYPPAEFGTLRARVLRVGVELASAAELQEAFGGGPAPAGEAWFRIDIALEPEQRGRIRQATLRPGMLLKARFTLRRRSLLALALEPLGKWLD